MGTFTYQGVVDKGGCYNRYSNSNSNALQWGGTNAEKHLAEQNSHSTEDRATVPRTHDKRDRGLPETLRGGCGGGGEGRDSSPKFGSLGHPLSLTPLGPVSIRKCLTSSWVMSPGMKRKMGRVSTFRGVLPPPANGTPSLPYVWLCEGSKGGTGSTARTPGMERPPLKQTQSQGPNNLASLCSDPNHHQAQDSSS